MGRIVWVRYLEVIFCISFTLHIYIIIERSYTKLLGMLLCERL